MKFCDKLKKLRSENNLTQEELAEKIFVTRTAVSKWETGKGYPGIDSLKEISRLFGVTIDELISEEDVAAKREKDGQTKNFLYCLSVVFLVAAAVFTLISYRLDNKFYLIGGILGVAGYVAAALPYSYLKRRGAHRSMSANVISWLIVISIVVFAVTFTVLELI